MFKNTYKKIIFIIICNTMLIISAKAQENNSSKSIEAKIDAIISSLTLVLKMSPY